MSASVSVIIFLLMSFEFMFMYHLCFSKKIINIWVLPVGCVIATVLTGCFVSDISGKIVVLYTCATVSVFFMVEEKWKQRIINFLLMFFLINCIEVLVDTIMDFISRYVAPEYHFVKYEEIIFRCLSVFILALMYILKKRKSGIFHKLWQLIISKIHYVVVVMVFVLLFTIAGLEVAEEYVGNPTFTIFANCICMIAYICVGALGVFVIYIKSVNKKMDELLHREKILNTMQQHYYEALLEKEEDTRRYRHDMINHFVCLKGMAGCQDTDGIMAYLDKMQEKLTFIQRKNYETGNKILDVITNYEMGMLGEDVRIELTGALEGNLVIDDMRLCTIYANLLENAREELEKEGNDKFLKITLLQGKEYIKISIQNSLSFESAEKKNVLSTQKKDKKNHGIGLKNVQEVVNECKGKLSLTIEEKCFHVEVILPNN